MYSTKSATNEERKKFIKIVGVLYRTLYNLSVITSLKSQIVLLSIRTKKYNIKGEKMGKQTFREDFAGSMATRAMKRELRRRKPCKIAKNGIACKNVIELDKMNNYGAQVPYYCDDFEVRKLVANYNDNLLGRPLKHETNEKFPQYIRGFDVIVNNVTERNLLLVKGQCINQYKGEGYNNEIILSNKKLLKNYRSEIEETKIQKEEKKQERTDELVWFFIGFGVIMGVIMALI